MSKPSAKLDFGGKKLNFIQIGLGTNCTFIHNINGEKADYNKALDFTFETSTEYEPEKVLGIAVEPVAALIEQIRPLADTMPGVQLVQAAMGEFDEAGAEMRGLSDEARDDLLTQVPPAKRQKLSNELEYLRNMSCLGWEHPLFPMSQKGIEFAYNVKVKFECNEKVDVWSWSKLVKSFNFVGCEVLLIDAEGCDAKILRSLLSFCKEHPEHWPDYIQFETMGHCDRHEGFRAEKAVLDALEQEGYTTIAMSDHNSQVVRTSVLDNEKRLQKWVYKWFCYKCYGQWRMPYLSNKLGIFCEPCFQELIGNREARPLKIRGAHLDSLVNISADWSNPKYEDETWWTSGYHGASKTWKPWEKNCEEEAEETEEHVYDVDHSAEELKKD